MNTNINANEVWQTTLDQLQLQMTRATFDQWLKGTSADMVDNRFTVFTPNAFAKDWLDGRLRDTVERTVTNVLEHSTSIDFAVGKPKKNGTGKQLALEGVREDEYADTVKPDNVFVGTQYFRQMWLPILGANLWCLILELRQRCYRNKETGEQRDTCKVSYDELAAAVGITRRTAMNLLKSEKASLFIISRQTVRRYSDNHGRSVNDTTHWQIRLDEPILTDELLDKLSKSRK